MLRHEGLYEKILSGFVRVVIHPRVFATPDPIEDALAFTETLRTSERAV